MSFNTLRVRGWEARHQERIGGDRLRRLEDLLDDVVARDDVAERLPHFQVVERRILIVEEQIVGAEVAIVRVDVLWTAPGRRRSGHCRQVTDSSPPHSRSRPPGRPRSLRWWPCQCRRSSGYRGLLLPLYLGFASMDDAVALAPLLQDERARPRRTWQDRSCTGRRVPRGPSSAATGCRASWRAGTARAAAWSPGRCARRRR